LVILLVIILVIANLNKIKGQWGDGGTLQKHWFLVMACINMEIGYSAIGDIVE